VRLAIVHAYFRRLGTAGYDARADLNGDGRAPLTEIVRLRNFGGQNLPTGEPTAVSVTCSSGNSVEPRIGRF
jgi:hypothetical protein